MYGPLDTTWPRTYARLGLTPATDPRDGLALGGYTNLISLDSKDATRSYAATGYLAPALKRSNLRVFTAALAHSVIFDHTSGEPTAEGVKFTKDGQVLDVFGTKEVILCAGAIGSPQILELSGVGNENILRKYGIKTMVENAHVGDNLRGIVTWSPLCDTTADKLRSHLRANWVSFVWQHQPICT